MSFHSFSMAVSRCLLGWEDQYWSIKTSDADVFCESNCKGMFDRVIKNNLGHEQYFFPPFPFLLVMTLTQKHMQWEKKIIVRWYECRFKCYTKYLTDMLWTLFGHGLKCVEWHDDHDKNERLKMNRVEQIQMFVTTVINRKQRKESDLWQFVYINAKVWKYNGCYFKFCVVARLFSLVVLNNFKQMRWLKVRIWRSGWMDESTKLWQRVWALSTKTVNAAFP